jgi:hypothetical protein
MNTIANEPTFILGFLFMLGILLILVVFAFAFDALIRLFRAKQKREEQKQAWRQFQAWIHESDTQEDGAGSPQGG